MSTTRNVRVTSVAMMTTVISGRLGHQRIGSARETRLRTLLLLVWNPVRSWLLLFSHDASNKSPLCAFPQVPMRDEGERVWDGLVRQEKFGLL